MKIIFKTIAILISLIISSSCVKEEMIPADPSFTISLQRDGQADAVVGTPFYVIFTGSGEFITLYNGTPGHVWGEVGAKGVDFNKADSIGVNYAATGKFNLTLVSSSTGDFGKDLSRNVKTVEVNVVDQRNTFTAFYINGMEGNITKDNEILFSVPDIITDFNFVPEYGLQSEISEVFVNGVEQTSKVTSNDFSQPVIYTVKAAFGNEKQYTVKISTFPASAEKSITKFVLGIGGNGEIGLIDEVNKTINLAANYGTNLSAVRLIVESSYASTMYLSNDAYFDRTKYNLSSNGVKSIKVVAQNGSEIEYKINVTAADPVSSFTFEGLVPAPVGVINKVDKTITIDVLKGTDVTKLIAKWVGSVGKVKIGTTDQTNGVTVNNFTTPKMYTFYKGDTAGDKYTVTVNVK